MDFNSPEFDKALSESEAAHSVRWFLCENPECKRIHVVLMDGGGVPFAHYVMPDNWKLLINGAPP